MQPMNPAGMPVVVLSYPAIIDKQSRYRNMKTTFAKQLIVFGVLQTLIGILCIIFQAVDIGVILNSNNLFNLFFVGHGFWNGIFFVITGSIGIAGGVRRNRCQVVAFNVLSILSACFSCALIGIAIPSAMITGIRYYCRYSYSQYNNCPYAITEINAGIAMESMMAILGLIEGIVAIWSSAICCTVGACCCACGGSCCCPPSPNQSQLFMAAGQQFPQQQPFIISNIQQQTNFPNQRQTMFAPDQQQTMGFAIINPHQQTAQYYPQQAPAYTALSPNATNQESYTRLNPDMTDGYASLETPSTAYDNFQRN